MEKQKSAKYFSFAELTRNPELPFSKNHFPGNQLVFDEKIMKVVKKDFLALLKSTENETA